jgi:hypothetical protein
MTSYYPPACVDCIFFVCYTRGDGYSERKCESPKNIKEVYNPVTGEIRRRDGPSPEILRDRVYSGDICGFEGHWFKPKSGSKV